MNYYIVQNYIYMLYIVLIILLEAYERKSTDVHHGIYLRRYWKSRIPFLINQHFSIFHVCLKPRGLLQCKF